MLPLKGLQLRFLRSDVSGSGGSAFGDTSETSTQIGGALFGGVGLHARPGLVLGELRFGFAPVSQTVTGSANVGALLCWLATDCCSEPSR
jgi:hypothetical protein